MSKSLVLLSILVVLIANASVDCKPADDHKSVNHDDLSDHEHFTGDHHNTQYDHEAFLGKDQAQEFEQMTRTDAKNKLGLIVDKVDKDKDGFVTIQELKDWIGHVAEKYVAADVERNLGHRDKNKDGILDWEEHVTTAYGHKRNSDEIYDKHRQLTFKAAQERDKKRFDTADTNKDGKLDKKEYGVFLHPHDINYMKAIVVDEMLQEMDKNKDGSVTVDEYIADIRPSYEQSGQSEDWVERERKHFLEQRDKDKDGRLNRDELRQWMAPEGYDPVEQEANHLIYEADTNKDKKLTKDEILSHQDLFAGSRATEYGAYLNKPHDEI